MCLY
ncbi:hypothetical protein CP8484711_0644A, partial [Chlamydia psittaci 84-8471/1]